MRVIFGLKQIKRYTKPVVALGVFDGVHLAHRLILKEAVKKARRIKGTSIALTFWPHPQGEHSLYSLEHRLKLLDEIGIDICIVISFNQDFSRMASEEFIKNILIKKINAHWVYVGKNFRFGQNAEGDFKLLRRFVKICHFKLKVFNIIRLNKQPISSTYIRKLIRTGNLNLAKRLLARPVSILGTVIKGASIAKRLGFPTANINPHHEILPAQGVYAVKILFGGNKYKGICYIGTRPTFKERKRTKEEVEVHIFGFKKNIYGKDLEIQFLKKIRGQKKFISPCSLAKQIKKDTLTVRNLTFPPLIYPTIYA